LSDLEHDPLAVTIVADASISGRQRARNPVFFEMAKNLMECGIGLGRHLINAKDAYTQLFAYLFGGAGSSRARYASAEIGIQHVFLQRHFFRVSLLRMKTFGRGHGSFCGIGTMKTDVNTIACSYAYRWYSGIEMRLTYVHRMLAKGSIRTSTTCQVGVSVPIAL
jgi:hypothetical protein